MEEVVEMGEVCWDDNEQQRVRASYSANSDFHLRSVLTFL
jgi:hypothetical protein